MRTLLILLCCNYINAQTLCDSLSYSIGTGSVLMVIGINSSSDSLVFKWGVCDKTACYSASGDTASFPLVNPLDTVKVCYDISPQWTCNACYYVVFNGFTWQVISLITYTSIDGYLISLPLLDGEIYDILGRKLKFTPKGKMYIRNNKLHMQK